MIYPYRNFFCKFKLGKTDLASNIQNPKNFAQLMPETMHVQVPFGLHLAKTKRKAVDTETKVWPTARSVE
jgi:hypothetical protein